MFAWKDLEERKAPEAADEPAGRLVWREVSVRRSLYEELGLSSTATHSDIRLAFRRRALELHPDRAAGDQATHDRMARLNEVYRTLGSEERRRAYDRSLG